MIRVIDQHLASGAVLAVLRVGEQLLEGSIRGFGLAGLVQDRGEILPDPNGLIAHVRTVGRGEGA